MKVKVIQDNEFEEDYVEIHCREVDQNIEKLKSQIENFGLYISGKLDGQLYQISLNNVFYFEAVENRVFAYTEKYVFEVNYKIQELNDHFAHTSFLQTSRTVVLNIDKIDHVTTLINGRILAVLQNKEKMIISRAYANNFKRKLQR